MYTRYKNEENTIEIEIEQGVYDGFSYSFTAEGDPHIEGDSGDLYLNIRILKLKLIIQ